MGDEDYERKLLAIAAELGVQCEHLIFSTSCASVEDAARTAGARSEEIVKSVCLKAKDGTLLVAVVRGADRIDLDKVGRALRIRRPRLAAPIWAEEKSGYPAGGTPPFGFDARFVVDRSVLDLEQVYCGGGSRRSLLRLHPADILAATGASVGDITLRDDLCRTE
jgi:Cys-tRNA(Pro)/Cys-tRNA(Cys) deacylase